MTVNTVSKNKVLRNEMAAFLIITMIIRKRYLN